MPTAKFLKLSEMTLLGLDAVYASHAGGPVQLTEIEIIEQLRFSTLQVGLYDMLSMYGMPKLNY